MLEQKIIMNTFSFPDKKAIALQAAKWIAKIDNGLSNKSQQSLSDWLEESPAHGEALVKYASMWDKFDILEPIASILPIDSYNAELSVDSISRLQANASFRSPIAGRLKYVIAASVLLPLALVFLLLQGALQNTTELINLTASSYVEVDTQVYESSVGDTKELFLPDGSHVSLNTDTEISVEYDSKQRKVVINRGEVYFDVIENPSKPFIVVTSDSHVTAVGTAFNVETNANKGTEVLVTEGRVKVDNFLNVDHIENIKMSEVFLSRGQKALIQQQQAKVSDYEDAESALAWRNGMIIFSGEPLEQVVAEIDRYTSLSFKIVDEDIASIQVGGGFRAGDTQQLLFVLEQNFGVQSEVKGQEILLSRALPK